MAVSCDPNALVDAAKCFSCLPPVTNLEVQTYLLAVLAGVTTDPNALAALANQFKTLSPTTLIEVQTYLLCQLVNK